MTGRLFYGDNLEVLRAHVPDGSVDLVYLDPPFNSQATYNVLFRAPSGEQAKAQIEAFEDTWHWNESAEEAFDGVMRMAFPVDHDLETAVGVEVRQRGDQLDLVVQGDADPDGQVSREVRGQVTELVTRFPAYPR